MVDPFMTSALPWSYEHDEENDVFIILDADANDVAILSEGTDKTVADFIIKSVNLQ
jgi:hypothetical protein